MSYLELVLVSVCCAVLVSITFHSVLTYVRFRSRFHLYWAAAMLFWLVSLGMEWAALELGGVWLQTEACVSLALAAPFLWLASCRLVGQVESRGAVALMLMLAVIPVLAGLAAPGCVVPCVAAGVAAFVITLQPLGRTLRSAAGGKRLRRALWLSWFSLSLLALVRPVAVGVWGPSAVTICALALVAYVTSHVMFMSYYDMAKLTRVTGLERLQVLLSSATDVVYSYRFLPNRRFEYMSPSIEGWTGVTAEEVCRDGRAMLKAIHPEDQADVLARLGGTTVETGPHSFRFVMPDGKVRWGEQRNVPVFNERGETIGLEGVMRDITDSAEYQKALAESEARYRTLFNGGSDMVLVASVGVSDRPARWIAVNDAVVQRLGYSREEIVMQEVYKTELYQAVGQLEGAKERLRAGADLLVNTQLTSKTGELIPVEAHIHPVVVEGCPAFIAVARDTSERRDLEARLMQAQKMEAMGRLAGGVAHDFNNVLSAIIGNADLLAIRMGDDHPHRKEVDCILEAGERAARLVRQLLVFSRRQPLKRRIIQLNDLITGMVPLLQSLVGERVRLRLDLDDSLGTIKGDPVQIEQVVLNLVVNARDAMPDGGEVSITTGTRVFGPHDFRPAGGLELGEYAQLTVRDTGSGIPAELVDRIFEPFFTTKNDGTGLGLATVYGIAQRMHGAVEVQSTHGKGATFQVFLPIEGGGDTTSDANWTATSSNLPPPKGTETILVVDDEPDVLQVAEHTLQELGYTVLTACAAEQAQRIVDQYPSTIHLLLSDVILPGLSGPQLAKQLRLVRPEMRILLMSGYSDGFLDEQTPNLVPFIPKPFSVGELGRKVRRVLDKT